MTNLDRIDREIVRALREDGRLTNVALAARVGLSPSACLRRVQLLEEAGTIRGYTAIIYSGDASDLHVAIVQVRLERQSEDMLRRFESEVLRHPEIRECFLITGEDDYVMRVETEGASDYERIHKDILSRLPGLVRITSSFAIRRVR